VRIRKEREREKERERDRIVCVWGDAGFTGALTKLKEKRNKE
jgi:hypothetical protein